MPDDTATFLPAPIAEEHSGNTADRANTAVVLRGTATARRIISFAIGAALLLAITIFYVASRPKNALYSTDTVYYLAGAKSLASGTGYRMVLYDDAPRIGLYPPLQSAYLSLFWRVNGDFPANVGLLNAAMILLLLICATLLFCILVRCKVPLWGAALVPLCFAVQPSTYGIVFGLMSDILFSMFSFLLALMWLGQWRISPTARWWATGVALGLMFLTRTAAAPIILGTALLLAINGIRNQEWKSFFCGSIPMAVAVVFWLVFPKDTLTYGHYFQETASGQKPFESGWVSYFAQCSGRAIDYASVQLVECLGLGTPHLLAASFPGSGVWARTCVAGIGLIAFSSLVIAVMGYSKHPQQSVRAIGWILLLYFVELVLWPHELGARAVMPLLPFVCYGFWMGVQQLPEAIRCWTIRAVSLVLIIGLLPSAYVTAAVTANPPDLTRTDEVKELSFWAREHIPPGARVATHLDWFKSDFPMMHFVSWSGHKLVQTKGESLRAFVGRTDFVLFERFPGSRQFIELPELGTVGEVVHRTPGNTFQIIKVSRERRETATR